MNDRIVQIGNLSDSNLQRIRRKSLECWKIYAEHKINRQRALRKAIYSYNVRLKQKVLNAFLENRTTAKKAQNCCQNFSKELEKVDSILNISRELESANFFKEACYVWSTNTKKRRRRKAAYMRIANFQNELLLRKYITGWKVLCSEKKRNVEFEKKAIEFHRHSLLQKSLRLWQQIHSDIFYERIKTKNAIVHYQWKLLTKIWLAWIKYCNVKIERSNQLEESRRFHERKLLARSFKLLSLNVSAMIEKRGNCEKSINYYTNKLLMKVLRYWIEYLRMKNEFENLVQKQRRKIENSTKSNVLKQWRLYVWKKKCSRRKMNISKSHYNKKLEKSAIASLRNYLMYRKKKKIRLSRLEICKAKMSLDRLRMHVEKWQIAAIKMAQERQKYRRAMDNWSSQQMKRYFKIWKLHSENYKLKAKRRETLHEIGKTVLLSKYTNLWLKKFQAVAKIREEEKRVLSMYQKKVQGHFFQSWKKYREEKIARRAEIEEATKFHRKIVLREGLKDILKMCLSKSETRYEKNLRCVKKNSIDDFEIMKKFFVRWFSLVDHRNKRNSRKIINSGLQNGICEFLPEAARLVLPEYMTKKPVRKNSDNAHFYEGNGLKDIFKNIALEKILRSSRLISVPEDANLPLDSEKLLNLSTQMYDIRKNVDEEARNFFDVVHNSSFSD